MAESKRILIVDDDKDFVESNRDLLEACGYEIFAEYDGVSGFETAKQEHPDLMILDVMMTHATEGFEIARKIKSLPELNAMKVLLVSGLTKDMRIPFRLDSADTEWLPVDHMLEKPIDPARFITEIERLLQEK